MTAADQVRLAGRLNAALLAAGLTVTRNQRLAGGRTERVSAELVDVVGWLAQGDYWIEEAEVHPTSHTGPTPYTPLVVIRGGG